jgi:hypothetical protein
MDPKSTLKPGDRPAPPPAVGSPDGPQNDHTDEAAGGADSSPFESQPSGMKYDAAHAPQQRDADDPSPPDR